MDKLTIVIPNRDRLDFNSNPTKFLFKSLENQSEKDFNIIIVDGGSKNIENLRKEVKNIKRASLIEHPLGLKFNKCILNNVGIRKSQTKYVMTTDADMFFSSQFINTLYNVIGENIFIESRTLYWKFSITDKIYSGKLDPFNDIDKCKIGRIKNRTTPGGCQCADVDSWNKVRGYDERYSGWGSEDSDLLLRMQIAGLKVVWLGESREEIMVFHQDHLKPNLQEELKDQDINKKYLNSVKKYEANENGWGGTIDEP